MALMMRLKLIEARKPPQAELEFWAKRQSIRKKREVEIRYVSILAARACYDRFALADCWQLRTAIAAPCDR